MPRAPIENPERTHLPLKNVPIRVANGPHVFLYHHRRGGVHLLVVETGSEVKDDEQSTGKPEKPA